MLKSDAAAFLAGVTQVEGAPASAPTNLHVITGEVGTTSEEGKTTISIDGLVFSEEDSQEIEIDTLGGLEEGDIATVILTGESGHGMTPLAIGAPGSVDRLKARVVETELLIADKADIEDLEAATARIGDLEADHVSVNTLEAATARIETLEVDHVSVADFEVEQANIDNLQAATADIDTIRANSAKVQNLTAAQLEADHATIGTLDTTYMHANMSNADVAWIQNGTIKNGAIVSAMINDVSANKLTAGTINGSVINVTNLNADNITTGTINGQRIGAGSLSLDKLSDDVYTESEVDSMLSTMQAEIDGAIETWTGTDVPTLNNSPASSWTNAATRDTHVGDVYFVVNSQSQQNGYNYRFTKTGSTYSWQLIKDNDVTNALQRLETAEGKITQFDSDISTLKTDTGTLTTRTTSLETRADGVDSALLDKVDTTDFNELSDTVDGHTQTLSQHTTAISNKADGSTVSALTTRVSKNEQDISGINTTIGELQTTVASKADGSAFTTVSNKLNTVSDTVDGHTQTLSSVQSTLSTKADNSTVQTLRSEYNQTKTTVSGHETRLTATESVANGVRADFDNLEIGGRNLLRNTEEARTQSATKYGAWGVLKPTYSNEYALDLDAGEYTLSFDWESDTELPADFYAWVGYGDTSGEGRAEMSGQTATRVGKNQTSGHYVYTFTWLDGNETYPYFACRPFRTTAVDALNGIVFTIKNAKLEKGNKPTDWTPALEDLETEVTTLKTDYANYKQTTTEALSEIGTTYATKTELSTETSNRQTAIQQLNNAITLKANSSDVYTKTQTDGLISTEVTNRNAAITAATDAIELSVSETYSTKTETAEISDRIVGRNLLRGTKDATADSWYLSNSTVPEDGVVKLTPTTSSTAYACYTVRYLDFAEYNDATYTVSLDVRRLEGNYTNKQLRIIYGFNTAARIGEGFSSRKGAASDRFGSTYITADKIGTDWTRLSATFSVPDDLDSGSINALVTGSQLTVEPYLETSGNPVEIRNLKLEKGAVATEWSAAPEDYTDEQVTAAKAAIKVTTDGITTEVAKKVNGTEIISTINQSAESVSINANKIDLQGAVTISDLASDAQNATLNSNISVGGRNLLRNIDSDSTTGNGITVDYDSDTHQYHVYGTNTKTDANYAIKHFYTSSEDYLQFDAGEQVTLSTDTPLTSGIYLNINEYKTGVSSQYTLVSLLGDGSTTSVTATVPSDHDPTRRDAPGFIGIRKSCGTVDVTFRIKLEKGNIATDWTPAPEDTPDQMTWYGTCSTAASTAAKVVTCDGFELQTGARITVKFTHINTTNAPTLDVNGTGAIATWYNNEVSSSSNPIRWGANATLNFIYDGSVWVLDERPPSYSATCSTSAATRLKTPSVVGALVVNGTRLSVRFSTANTYTDNAVQISLASTGAYNVYQNNALTSTTNQLLWDANTVLTFVAQGTGWHLLSRSDAYKTATSYVTEITGQNGIMVHPSTDQTTGVRVTSDVDILRGGTSVAEYGETVRIGAESSDHVAIDSNELMFHDGTNAVMQVGGSCQITEKHVCGSSTSEVFYLSLEPSDGAKFRVINTSGEIVSSNYTLSRSEKRCTLTNKSGTALDGETVLVFYQSSGMVLYDEGDVSSTFTTDQASFAGGMFELSYKDRYSSIDGTLTDSTAEISMSKHRDRHSSISLNTTPNGNRSFMTFQASGTSYAAFVLDSGSTGDPTRSLDLIYLDEINYADPYGGSDRQLGKPTRLSASKSMTLTNTSGWTDGPSVNLEQGHWLVVGVATFNTGSSSGVRKLRAQIRIGTSVYQEGTEINVANNGFGRIEAVMIANPSSDLTATLVLQSGMTFTTESTSYITAIRLA